MADQFPVAIQRVGNEYIASFKEAGVSMSGRTAAEAAHLLAEHVKLLFSVYRSERQLGTGPARQLRAMEKYLGEGWQSLYR